MIQRLQNNLGISAEILVQPYELAVGWGNGRSYFRVILTAR